MKRLASDGMVEIIPYRGAVVRTLNKRGIDEAYAGREALEHLAVSEAIAHMEPQNIQELYGLTEAYRESADPSEICALSQQFDEYIYRMAQNHTLYELLGMLKGTISRDKKYSSANIERRAAIYEEHRAIVAAIESQDKERARQAVSNHIRNGRSFIEEKG